MLDNFSKKELNNLLCLVTFGTSVVVREDENSTVDDVKTAINELDNLLILESTESAKSVLELLSKFKQCIKDMN